MNWWVFYLEGFKKTGLGILNLPSRVASTGVLLSFVFLVFSLALGCFTLESLNWASEMVKCKSDIHKLSRKLLGQWADTLFQISIILISVGASVCNIISASQFMLVAYQYFSGHEHEKADPFTGMMVRLVVGILVSMSFYFKELTSLRYVSFLSLFLLSYLVVVMIGEAPDYINSEQINHDYHWVSFNFNLEGIYRVNAAFPTFTYAFLNQANILPIKEELRDRTQEKVSRIILWAELASSGFFLAVMYVGYFSLGQNCPELIFSRPSITKGDYFLKIGMILYGFYLLTCVPLIMLPTKIAITRMIHWKRDNNWHQAIIGTFLAIVVLLISVFFSNISGVLNIIAGVFATYIGVTGPGLIFIAAYHKYSKSRKGFLFWGAAFTCTLVTVLGLGSTIISIYVAFFPFPNKLSLE